MQRQKRTLLDAAGSADPATFVQYICDNYKGEANALSELLQLFTTKEWHALWKGVHGTLAHIIEAGFVLPSSQPASAGEADRGSLAQIPCDLGAAGDKEDDDGEEGITQDMAAATLEDSHLEEDEEDQQERRDAKLAALIGLQYMEAVVPLIEYFLQDSSHKNASPDMLLQILRLFHDNVFLQVHTMAEELGSIAPIEAEEVEGKAMMQQLLFGLSNSICNICEMWWKQERPDKEVLVPHTILFLLANALDEGGKAADVKRLYEFRASLLLLDFQDEESSLTLKRLLLQSAMHPLFLHTADGKKFLVYLFGLYPPFIDDLHATIKAQLFSSNKTMLKAYGEVYFKAWRSAEGAYKLKLEYDCIQDLMSNAIHLQNETLLGAIRRILSCFHQEKKQRGVDEMLLRLYEPILWRSLKVANALVRRNAALLLFEAFPIQDPDSPAREVDEQLQKQFEVLAELMHDPAAEVRCVAAQGVCRILGVFWELIPLATTRALLGSLINELARDKSSSAVRAAVFEGLRFLLDNHLCHPTLKTLLPQLANLIHDNSERVRGAFLSLLCDIKQLRSIRFYEVVPLEHLLARLPLEAASHPNGPLVKRLCQLLLNSYFPVERKPSVQAKRCVVLLQCNTEAGRAFYSNIHHFVAVGPLSKFVVTLYRLLCKFSQRKVAKENNGRLDKRRPRAKSTKAAETEEGVNEEGEQEQEEELTEQLLESVLEVICIVWEAIAPLLKKKENRGAKDYLYQHFQDTALEQIAVSLESSNDSSVRTQELLLRLAAHLPKTTIPQFSSYCESQLELVNVGAPAMEYAPLLRCMFAWQQQHQVLQLIHEWLQSCEEVGHDDDDEETPLAQRKPLVALQLLNCLLQKESTRQIMFPISDKATILTNSPSEAIDNILSDLKQYWKAFRRQLTHSLSAGNDEDDAEADRQYGLLPLLSLPVLCRMLLHMAGSARGRLEALEAAHCRNANNKKQKQVNKKVTKKQRKQRKTANKKNKRKQDENEASNSEHENEEAKGEEEPDEEGAQMLVEQATVWKEKALSVFAKMLEWTLETVLPAYPQNNNLNSDDDHEHNENDSDGEAAMRPATSDNSDDDDVDDSNRAKRRRRHKNRNNILGEDGNGSEGEDFATMDCVTENVGIIAIELVAFGLCDDSTTAQITEFVKGLLAVKRESFVSSLAVPLAGRLLYHLYHKGSHETQATILLIHMLKSPLPKSALPQVGVILGEIFGLLHHRGTLSTSLLSPLLKEALLPSISSPYTTKPGGSARSCNSLASSISHLRPKAAFMLSTMMRSGHVLAALADSLELLVAATAVPSSQESHDQEDGDDEDRNEEEQELTCFWKILEVVSVLVHQDAVEEEPQQDATGRRARGGRWKRRQAACTAVQNCLSGIMAKFAFLGGVAANNGLVDEDEENQHYYDGDKLSAGMIRRLANQLSRECNRVLMV